MADDGFVRGLRDDVEDYAAAHKGRMYAPILHPAFEGIPFQHGHQRWGLIEANIPAGAKTALDIGTHWGYFAHKLEDYGLDVTAAEKSGTYLDFLNRIRQLCGKHFEVFPHSVFELPAPLNFDVVIAFNIFHHFIKSEKIYDEFVTFLERLECKVMFFQAHNPAEGQMEGSFRNFLPGEFASFVADKAGLSTIEEIGRAGQRPVFILR